MKIVVTHYRKIRHNAGTKLKKVQNRKFPHFLFFRGTNCRVEAKNNRETVVVCAPHVVNMAITVRFKLVRFEPY